MDGIVIIDRTNLPEFYQLSSPYSADKYYNGDETAELANGLYLQNPQDTNSDEQHKQQHALAKNPLLWGDDVLFPDQPGGYRNSSATMEEGNVDACVDEDSKTALHQQLTCAIDDGQDASKVLVTLSELSDITGLTDSDKFMNLPDFNFFPKDGEGDENLNELCSTLQLVESQGVTLEEVSTTPEQPSPVAPAKAGRAGLRRTRTASRRYATPDDGVSFCSQADSFGGNIRRRNVSEHSIASTVGSYDDPDSPSYGNKKKRRRYEEDPSDDPAFEKSRKNAIIAKRNREKKKQLMEEMETHCHQLETQNEILDTDNGKLRTRVKTLEEEVFYLKSVLANQSALSNVLSTLRNVDNLRFSTSFDPSKYSSKKSANNARVSASQQHKVSGGVCLHVDGNQVSLEMCAKCAQMACGAPHSSETTAKPSSNKRVCP